MLGPAKTGIDLAPRKPVSQERLPGLHPIDRLLQAPERIGVFKKVLFAAEQRLFDQLGHGGEVVHGVEPYRLSPVLVISLRPATVFGRTRMGATHAYEIGLLTVRLQLILDADLVPPEITHVVFVDEARNGSWLVWI